MSLKAFATEQMSAATPEERDDGLIRVVGVAMQARQADERAARASSGEPELAQLTDAQLGEKLTAAIGAGDWLAVAIMGGHLFARSQINASE